LIPQFDSCHSKKDEIEMGRSHNDENISLNSKEGERHPFLLAIIFTLIFSIDLSYAVYILPWKINEKLEPIFPDYGLISLESSVLKEIRLIGYVCFGITIILIVLGYLTKRYKLTLIGSLTVYLPIFGHYAGSMFIFGGIGILRSIWSPFYDISILSINLLTLGDIILLPDILLRNFVDEILRFYDQISPAFFIDSQMPSAVYLLLYKGLGVSIFVFSTITWFYGKFSGKSLIDFWIYKYSRHPQYLGLLLWSYGLLLELQHIIYPKGGHYPLPTFPWLIFACLILGIALQEEIKLVLDEPNDYLEYRQTSSFMIPLPRQVSNFLCIPIRLILKKDWPVTRKEGIFVWFVYSSTLVIFSLLFVIFFNPLFSAYHP
jgi:protein-S-isoprenylcysteine O-methyltransferase Ste14